jgi:hypothetical protein
MPTDTVTTPGAASAAVGVSNMAATKSNLSFMAGSSLHVGTPERDCSSVTDHRTSQNVKDAKQQTQVCNC